MVEDLTPPPPAQLLLQLNSSSSSTAADQPDAAGERGQSFHRRGGPVAPLGDGERANTHTQKTGSLPRQQECDSLMIVFFIF